VFLKTDRGKRSWDLEKSQKIATPIRTRDTLTFSEFCNTLQSKNFSSYHVQSPNISNQSAQSIEKYVRNVVDDVVNSHGVVAMNALSMLWSGRNTIS